MPILSASLVLTACGADSTPDPTRTVSPLSTAVATGTGTNGPPAATVSPTDTAVAVPSSPSAPTERAGVVVGPLVPAEAFAQLKIGDLFVVDLPGGLVYRLVAPPSFLCWVDDGTLVSSGGDVYRIGGPTRTIAPNECEAPENRLVPRAGGRVWENAESLTSADAVWTLERDASGPYIVRTDGQRIEVPDTHTFAWSPVGHLLAIGGGWCSAEPPLRIINPDTGSEHLVSNITGRALAYVWRPDASALVVGHAYGGAPVLLSVRPSDGISAPIPPQTTDDLSPLIPLAVSPSATRVLFYFYTFRPCS